MTRATAIRFLLLGQLPLLNAQDKKRKGEQPKPPDLTMVQVTCLRSEGEIVIDGRVKNTGGKPLVNVDLLIDFMAPGKQVITTKRGPVESDMLAPQDEAEFHLRINDYVRAVQIQFNAEQRDKGDLRVEKMGPYAIE